MFGPMAGAGDRRSEREVGMFDLRARLGRWLARVRRGETLVVTRHGEPVARIVPILGPSTTDVARRKAAIERWLEASKGTRLPDGMSIRDLIDEGRKW